MGAHYQPWQEARCTQPGKLSVKVKGGVERGKEQLAPPFTAQDCWQVSLGLGHGEH